MGWRAYVLITIAAVATGCDSPAPRPLDPSAGKSATEARDDSPGAAPKPAVAEGEELPDEEALPFSPCDALPSVPATCDATVPDLQVHAVEKIAYVFDALTLDGRDWYGLGADPWGMPDSPGAAAQVLKRRPLYCASIQWLAHAEEPVDWDKELCESDPDKIKERARRFVSRHRIKDTRATDALRTLCKGLASSEPPFEVAVFAFDHIVDAPSEVSSPPAAFAKQLGACVEQGLIARLIAQPLASRYLYVFGREGTHEDVDVVAMRLAELLGASEEHTNSANAILRRDSRACEDGRCPTVYSLVLSPERLVRPSASVAFETNRPEWGIDPGDDRRTKLLRSLPAGMNKIEETRCGATRVIDAHREYGDEASAHGLRVTWNGTLGALVPLETFPFLRAGTRVGVQAVGTAETRAEAGWESALSVETQVHERGGVVDASALATPDCAWAGGANTRLITAARFEPDHADLLWMTAHADDTRFATYLEQAFAPADRTDVLERSDPASVKLAQQVGWILGGRIPQHEGLRIEWVSTGVEVECTTAEIRATLASVRSFGADDFDAELCSASRTARCPSLRFACSGEGVGTGDTMGALYRDLLAVPDEAFRCTNPDCADSVRGAALAIAEALGAIGDAIGRTRDLGAPCIEAAIEIGCIPRTAQ